MNVTQLSLFLENKPGHLQSALKVLAEEGINIMTLTIAEVADFGIVRMIVNKPQKALEALRQYKFVCSPTDVLAIELDDKPGSLLKALETFARRNLNIEYMYAFTEKRGDRAVMIFKFADIEEAKKALLEEGFNVVKKIDLIGE
jgi:hypothetical protein